MKKMILIIVLAVTLCFAFSSCGDTAKTTDDFLLNLTFNVGEEKIALPTTVGKLFAVGFEVDEDYNIENVANTTTVKPNASYSDVKLSFKEADGGMISIGAANYSSKEISFEECVVSNISLQVGTEGEQLSFNGFFNCEKTLGQIKEKYGVEAISGYSMGEVKNYYEKVSVKSINLMFTPQLDSEKLAMVSYYWEADI